MYDIKQLKDGRVRVGLPVEYTMIGEVRWTFGNIEELKERVKDPAFIENLPLPDPHDRDYMDDSYTINETYLDEMIDSHLKSLEERQHTGIVYTQKDTIETGDVIEVVVEQKSGTAASNFVKVDEVKHLMRHHLGAYSFLIVTVTGDIQDIDELED